MGMEKVDYVKKDSGEVVDAYNFHVTRNDANVDGDYCDRIYVPAVTLTRLRFPVTTVTAKDLVGREIDVDYNSRGFLINIGLLTSTPSK